MLKTIYLAGGCFWGTAHLFSLVRGVETAEAGYANSTIPNPTYKQVCTGDTHAAETVRVVYDDERVSLEELLGLYFRSIDPVSVNKQGGDVGTQYRTGIYYTDVSDLPIIETLMAEVAQRVGRPLAVELLLLQNFYPAEDYHQDYLYKNPEGYCHIDFSLFQEAKKM